MNLLLEDNAAFNNYKHRSCYSFSSIDCFGEGQVVWNSHGYHTSISTVCTGILHTVLIQMSTRKFAKVT